jgi:hypothetical protein
MRIKLRCRKYPLLQLYTDATMLPRRQDVLALPLCAIVARSIHMSTFRLWLIFTMLAVGTTALSACTIWEGANDDVSTGTDAAAGDDDDFDADNDDDDE